MGSNCIHGWKPTFDQDQVEGVPCCLSSDEYEPKVPVSLLEKSDYVIKGQDNAIIRYFLLPSRRFVLVETKDLQVYLWDLVKCICIKTFELSFEQVSDQLAKAEESWAPSWCSLELKLGVTNSVFS